MSPPSKHPQADKAAETTPTPDRIRYHYLKSSTFHTVHADGVFGGVTPAAGFHLAFFAERFPIPTQVEVAFDGEGKPVGEIPGTRVVRDGLIRELQVDVFLTVVAAEALHQWLGKHLAKVRELIAEEK